MTIDATCPSCGTLYTLRRELIGKRTKCTRCGTHFVIAEAPAAALPPPRAPASTGKFEEAFTGIPAHLPPPVHHAQLGAPTSASASTSGREFPGFESDRSSTQFPAMRLVARSCEIAAAIALILAAVLLFEFFYRLIVPSSDVLGPSPVSIAIGFFGALSMALMLLVAAQSIRLGLQIEQNTRESAQACRQLAEHFSAIQTEP